MASKVDLHIHTTASDGRLAPEEVVQLAAERGLQVIAITDHDTVAGIQRAIEASHHFPDLTVIPALEINTDTQSGEVHILGYYIDYNNAGLQKALERLRSAREVRARKIVSNLAELDIDVSWERVLELAGGGSVGRPHIAQAMFEGGYIPSLQEAFIKYIGRHGPAYAERERLSPKEAVELVISAQGLPVLAHPMDIDNLENLIVELKQVGLVGLETYYNGYHNNTIKKLTRLASKYDLITTGGSDCHGLGSSHETPLGGVEVPLDCVKRLETMLQRNHEELRHP